MTTTKPLTAAAYFTFVGVITFVSLAIWAAQNAAIKQNVKEVLGLSDILQAADGSFYHDRIEHIFNKYCVGCHSDEKAKGHLRLDSYRQTVFGGKSGNILTGGEHSLLFERMSLPAENRLAMPPYGRDRQTADEMKLLQLWLEKGASGTLTPADFPNAPAKIKEIHFTEINWQQIAQQRAPLAEQVKNLQQQYPFMLSYQARVSELLELDASITQQTFTDADLAKFASVKSALNLVNLKGTKITDQSAGFIVSLSQVEKINLQGTQVTAITINQLNQLANLKRLIIHPIAGVERSLRALSKVGVQVQVVEQ